jgi:DNA polymerase
MSEATSDRAKLRADLAEHLRFLQDLGVQGFSRDQAWRVRSGEPVNVGGPEGPPSRETDSATAAGPGDRAGAPPVDRAGARTVDQAGARAFRPASPPDADLAVIRADLGDCTRCKLHRLGRRQIVFGAGDPHARLMFVGEAPGHDEDAQGIPFVGRAGQLLTKIIEAITLTREDVYIANVIKCRPPENRNPEPDEVDACEPFLFRQVQTIQPKVIVALGTFAAHVLLKTQDPISRLRGRIYRYGDAMLIPTFHPAYLLRSPERKRDTWEDMKKVRALLNDDDV